MQLSMVMYGGSMEDTGEYVAGFTREEVGKTTGVPKPPVEDTAGAAIIQRRKYNALERG